MSWVSPKRLVDDVVDVDVDVGVDGVDGVGVVQSSEEG